jgi:ribonuclease D
VSAPPPLLTKESELTALAKRANAGGRLAIDTEFVWERTYRPILGVVQLATDDDCAVVDAQEIESLEPLFPLLADPELPIVLHGGGQDLEILAEIMGEPVRAVVDTQIEAAFLGYGLQVGLGALLERVLKVRIRKDQTYTDWTRRPLRPEQLDYARTDVIHLLSLHDRLREALERRGRVAWVDEELHALEAPGRYTPAPDTERYRSVKGWQRHNAQELAVLRSLAAWRERAARRANVRPNYIANDVVLTTLAARPVDDIEDLRQIRGLSRGTVDRHARGILTALKEGVACPKERWPEAPPRVRRQAPPPGLTALLRAAVQAVAEREDLAPEVIASGRELDALVGAATRRDGKEDELADLALLGGWRRDLVGERLLRIARGEIAVRYDPARREIVEDAVSANGRPD